MKKEPTFRTKEAFKVVGIERYTDKGLPAIREAWDAIGPRYQEIKHIATPPIAYGVEDYKRDFDMNAGGFPKYYYLAGFEVTDLADIPDGMTGREIPASTNFAVFDYSGPMANLHEFFKYIYGEWMPASGYKMDNSLAFDFERYPEKMTDPQNMRVEIWVPVIQAKS